MKYFYGRQHIDQSDIRYTLRVLKSNFLTQGAIVNDFEKKLKKNFGAKYAIAVSSGSAALHLLAKALNWNNKDTIATTPLHLQQLLTV